MGKRCNHWRSSNMPRKSISNINAQTDLEVRKGKHVNLLSDFSCLKDPLSATLIENEDTISSNVDYRYYPRDGEVWWVVRQQIDQLRSAAGLENFDAELPERVANSSKIKYLNKNPVILAHKNVEEKLEELTATNHDVQKKDKEEFMKEYLNN